MGPPCLHVAAGTPAGADCLSSDRQPRGVGEPLSGESGEGTSGPSIDALDLLLGCQLKRATGRPGAPRHSPCRRLEHRLTQLTP
jgi:hypothetical protein